MDATSGREETGPFEVGGTVAPVTVLRLKSANLARIDKQLKRIAARQAFPYAPVIVDVAALDEEAARELALHDLAERIRACKLVPVGAANLPGSAVWNAAAAGMGVVDLTPPPAVEQPKTVTVRQTVRAGQVVHAHGADLIVLAAVNAGAQVIADGNVHVYGALRGRALAGVKGDVGASVFCLALEAELVSIAGQYVVADKIPAEHRGARAQLHLEDGHMCIRRL
jgi:septum site-determining protein MinC